MPTCRRRTPRRSCRACSLSGNASPPRQRAEGAEASAKIRADAERDRTVLLAEARATSDKLRGEGEGEATRISAKAYSQDVNFYSAWRTLQAYRDSFESGASRLVLTPDNDFLRFLQSPPTPAGP